jgi:hypothetical protein
MNKKEQLDEFYNYKYWREIQRNQLNTSSNIIFTFSATIIGFTINYLLNEGSSICSSSKFLFIISIFVLLISTLFYLVFNISKLIDYKKTARHLRNNVPFEEISKKTWLLGRITWYSFLIQLGIAFFGFLFSVIIFTSIIL